MTPEQRAESRAICEAATEGPWDWAWQFLQSDPQAVESYVVVKGICPSREHYHRGEYSRDRIALTHRHNHGAKDAAFIAHARQALPAALDALDALDAELKAIIGSRCSECRQKRSSNNGLELINEANID